MIMVSVDISITSQSTVVYSELNIFCCYDKCCLLHRLDRQHVTHLLTIFHISPVQALYQVFHWCWI